MAADVAYKSAGAGVATEASGGALSPLCPATVDAGDILIAHCGYEGTTTAPSTPSGWTLLSGPHTIESAHRHWIFGRIADGSEDGAAVAFGTPAVTTMRTARVYSFSGYLAGTITQIVPSASFSHQSHATDPQMPTVTTGVVNALAVACVFQLDDNATASATGESGGNWAEAVTEYLQSATTPDSGLSLQTCVPSANPGTVSGGSISTTDDPCGVIGFEIRPAPDAWVQPGTGALDLTGIAPSPAAYDKIWTGLGATNNWSDGDNWNGGSVPSGTHDVLFSGEYSVKNCTVDDIVTFAGTITIDLDYTGTITQNVAIVSSGAAFYMANGTWNQAAAFTVGTFTMVGGTFTGASQSMSTAGVQITSGVLTATSGTWTVTASFLQTGSPTFNANGGTIAFTSATSASISAPGCTFNLITISKSGAGTFLVASGTTVPLGSNPTTTMSTGGFTVDGTVTGSGRWIATTSGTTTISATGTISGFDTLQVTRSLTIASAATIPTLFVLDIRHTGTSTISAIGHTLGTCLVDAPGSAQLTIASNTTLPLGNNPSTDTGGATANFVVSGTVSGTGTWTSEGNIVVSGGGTISGFTKAVLLNSNWDCSATGTIPANFDVTFSLTTATTTTFTGGGKTYGAFVMDRSTATATAICTVEGSNTFSYIQDNAGQAAHQLRFTESTTTTMTDANPFRVAGVSGKNITLRSPSTTVKHILTATHPSAVISCDFLTINDSQVDASPVWYAGANSTDGTDNTNWVFTAPPATTPRRVPQGLHTIKRGMYRQALQPIKEGICSRKRERVAA